MTTGGRGEDEKNCPENKLSRSEREQGPSCRGACSRQRACTCTVPTAGGTGDARAGEGHCGWWVVAGTGLSGTDGAGAVGVLSPGCQEQWEITGLKQGGTIGFAL